MNETEMLKQGKVGVIPTDTLYGVLASASDEQAIRRVYELKGRAPTKPCIILISKLDDLKMFGTTLTEERKKILARFWPGPVSIVLPCGDSVPEYLHRGTQTLAFRLPDSAELISFLKESGPCIAPSVNPEGLPPAETIEEAKNYFGDKIDFYTDGGKRSGMPSTLIVLDEHNVITVLRQGKNLFSVSQRFRIE